MLDRQQEPPYQRTLSNESKDSIFENNKPNDIGKVPAVTFGFWIIKILATTLGEIGGDAVTMSMNLGYLLGTAIFAIVFAAPL
jgi:uncharacterized membrane-anchored protein